MDNQEIANILTGLRDADLALRDKLVPSGQLFDGYHSEMEKLHLRNADCLNQFIERIGYPTTDKVGEEASEAAWLVIQHAISLPAFMVKCRTLLEVAVLENKANPKNLAYLTDRIAVLSGEPQLYGTQFDWDENRELSPNLYDDLDKVNYRRKAIGLNSLEDQTILIRNQAKSEKRSSPVDFENRKQEYEAWRKSVGWVR
ncbi:DUF6624 domain-containing protein [Lunatibacter salilacus]|uniref:DUF6624 domain-containing protein n=1 Tax=Lunatibacter salilacus TaxID=2483804 RepID=UPI00131B5392|nr:DUF6624 domain-containing protein [Lunatibacter salilacus]